MVSTDTRDRPRHRRRHVPELREPLEVSALNAAPYERLSDNQGGTRDGVERQDEAIRGYIARNQWTLAPAYVDDDLSAYKKHVMRPAWLQMLDDVRAGIIDVIVFVRSDRLCRQPRDLEKLLDLIEEQNKKRKRDGRPPVKLCSVSEDMDFGSPVGILALRIFISVAAHASDIQSERLKNKWAKQAREGIFVAGQPNMYGINKDGTANETAPWMREAAERVIKGEPIHSIVRDWNDQGRRTLTGKEWKSTNLMRALRSPRLAGYANYGGELIYHTEADDHVCTVCRTAWPCDDALEPARGLWDPVIDPERWWLMQERLDIRQSNYPKAVRKHLLTGILMCSKNGCDGVVGGQRYWNGSGATDRYQYRCQKCRVNAVMTDVVDDWVRDAVIARVCSPKMLELRARVVDAQGDSKMEELLANLRDCEETLERVAADHYAKLISRKIFVAESQRLTEQIERMRAQLSAISTASPLDDVPTVEVELRAMWDERGIIWRRRLIQALVTKIDLVPGGKGANRRPIKHRLDPHWIA